MSAWVPAWDPNAVATLEREAGKLHEANPGWYTIAADGTFTRNWGAEDPRMRAALAGVDLVPTIKNYVNGGFDGNLVASVIGSPTLRETHAAALTQLVIANAFAGIDIDYERVPVTSRSDFTAFIELLAAQLHGSGKLLSVTVHAKTVESNRNGPGAQDWAAIGAVADSVKIMAYDKHWSTSEAGPIAPLDWLDQIATYAEATIPAGKAIIGLPWYGYDWLGMDGDSVTYAEAMARAQSAGAVIGRDEHGEATFSYDGRTVFFQDAVSYEQKILAIVQKHSKIGGFAHWRVGAEDPATWAKVAQFKEWYASETEVTTPKKRRRSVR